MQTKEQPCFEEGLVLIIQSNASMHYIYMCVSVCVHVCVFSQPCTWTMEGSDHIYQVHSQFCSGISSISLSTPSLVFENTHLQPASNHAPRFSNVLTPSDLQLFVWWVAKEVWLPSNLTLYTICPLAYTTIPNDCNELIGFQGWVFRLNDYLYFCECVN